MQPPCPRDRLRELLNDIVARNMQAQGSRELQIDVVFSGGLEGCTMKQSGRGAYLYVAVQELIEPPAEAYEHGVTLASFPHMRLWPDIKLLNYVGAVIAHQTVVPQKDAYEVVYVDPADRRTVLEGSTFTVFFVDSQGQIVTPPLNGRILDSITRRVVFELLASGQDPKIRESIVRLDHLSTFAEAFIASTTRAVLPVVCIDDITIGDGKPGPVTRKVMSLFQEYIQSY